MALFSKFHIGNYSITKDNSAVVPTSSFPVESYHMVTRCNDDGFHPTTSPKTEFIEIVLQCDFTPLAIYKWYRTNNPIEGCIVVDIPESEGIRNRMVVFEGAQCFFYNEKYTFSKSRHQVTIRIAVEKLLVENNVYQRS